MESVEELVNRGGHDAEMPIRTVKFANRAKATYFL